MDEGEIEAGLEAKINRLQAEVDSITSERAEALNDNARLQAEVEELRALAKNLWGWIPSMGRDEGYVALERRMRARGLLEE